MYIEKNHAQEVEKIWSQQGCLLVYRAEFLGQECCLLVWSFFPLSDGIFQTLPKIEANSNNFYLVFFLPQLSSCSFDFLVCQAVQPGGTALKARGGSSTWGNRGPWNLSPAVSPPHWVAGCRLDKCQRDWSSRQKVQLLLLIIDGAFCTRRQCLWARKCCGDHFSLCFTNSSLTRWKLIRQNISKGGCPG